MEEAHEDVDGPSNQSASPVFDPNVTPSESSFTPDALVSSTPMVGAQARQRSNTANEETPPSWEVSMESPFDRLDKGLRSLGQEEVQDSIIDRSRQSVYDDQSVSQSTETSATHVPVFTAQQKGKGKTQPSSLLQSVLSKNIREGEASPKKHTSPLKARQKAATPKRNNPYARSDAARAQWDGIVDLSKQHAAPDERQDDWNSEEEDHTFQPHDVPKAVPSRFATQVGRTPVREAAARIGRDLIGRAEQSRQPLFGVKRGHTEPDSPESPGMPSLSMYSRRALGMENESLSSAQSGSLHSLGTDVSHSSAASGSADVEQPSLRGMIRQFGLDAESESYASSLSHQMSDAGGAGPEDSFEDSFDDDTPAPPVFASLALQGGTADVDAEMDSDSDSDDDGRPGAGFLMAGGQQSYDSDHSSDSMDGDAGGDDYADEEEAAGAPIHPFARGYAGPVDGDDSAFDDSFDDPGQGEASEEPTLFGVGQPAQRGGNLQLLGQDLIDDTTALNERLRASLGGVPETPTPWSGTGL